MMRLRLWRRGVGGAEECDVMLNGLILALRVRHQLGAYIPLSFLMRNMFRRLYASGLIVGRWSRLRRGSGASPVLYVV